MVLVESCYGFVEEEDLGLHGEHGGKCDEVFFAAGEFVCEAVFVVRHIELVECVLSDIDGLFFYFALVEWSEGDIFEYGWAEELVVGILEEQAELCADGSEVDFCFSGLVENFDGAGSGFDQSEDEV